MLRRPLLISGGKASAPLFEIRTVQILGLFKSLNDRTPPHHESLKHTHGMHSDILRRITPSRRHTIERPRSSRRAETSFATACLVDQSVHSRFEKSGIG